MSYFFAAVALLLHTLWWGAGLAWLLTPRQWRRAWPLFAPVAGFLLQTAIVWAGLQVDLPGTRVYAGGSELIPLVLLIGAWRLRSRESTVGAAWRRTGAVWAVTLGVLGLLVRPLSQAAEGLTTLSLGSCDAADYATGARLMLEFSRSDRSGFLGLGEVLQLGSVDNLADHFIRLNHFAPSALLAHHAAIFDWEPYEITGVLTAVFLAASVPLVFWLGRATLRLPPRVALAVSALYGCSPVTWYAVAHGAMGQLLGAQAVALLTAAGIAAWRGRRGARPFLPLLVVAFGLLLAAYHFFIVVAWLPAAAAVAWEAVRTRKVRVAIHWTGWLLLALVLAAVAFPGRVAGVVERFRLFQEIDFGWKIAALTPEGWLGLVQAPHFAPWRLDVRVAVLLLLAAVLFVRLRRDGWGRRHGALAAALTLPPVAGYVWLQGRGLMTGSNASYDAYKLLSVYYPGLLVVLGSALTLLAARHWTRWLALALAMIVGCGNAVGVATFSRHLRHAPLIVDAPLEALQAVENRPEVTSVNLRVRDMWSRLWAHSFLLRTPHYFPVTTYEGRRATELKGAWDLSSGIVRVHGLEAADHIALPEPYELRRRGCQALLIELGAGWFELERLPRSTERWRWTEAPAELWIENPSPEPVQFELQVEASSLIEREWELQVDSGRVGRVRLGPERAAVRFPAVTVPTGRMRFWLGSPQPGTVPGGGDTRALLACVYRIDVRIQRPSGAGLAAVGRFGGGEQVTPAVQLFVDRPADPHHDVRGRPSPEMENVREGLGAEPGFGGTGG